MAMLSRQTVDQMGFAAVGDNIQISDRASFYGIDRITLGNNVRIDDFCVLSAGLGGIYIGQHVHIAVYSSLIGAKDPYDDRSYEVLATLWLSANAPMTSNAFASSVVISCKK